MAAYAIGIDIGGTKTLLMIQNEVGEIVLTSQIPSSREVADIVSLTEAALEEAGIPNGEVAGLCVGIPGRVDSRRGIVLDAPSLYWKNLNIREKLQRHFPFPVYVQNDVTLALIGEMDYGGLGEAEHIVLIAIGTGLGSAMMIRGEVYEGSHNCSGEIGYFIEYADALKGLDNRSGHFGTTEGRISGTALNRKMREKGIDRYDISAWPLDAAAGKEVIETFILQLSCLIANITSLLNPEMIILGGGIGEKLPGYLGAIRSHVSRFTPIDVRIVTASMGNRAGALGGCAHVRNRQSCKNNHKTEG